jgi:glycosyltransferase involved in cell wall biosynthesis
MREAIESVIDQTYPHWELLLVDDGSKQESVEVALEYVDTYPRKIHYLQHEGHKNRGASISRQLGIDAAQGELIAFLDADDLWLPNKLEQQVLLMDERPEVGMLFGNTLYWYSWKGDDENLNQDYVPKLGYAIKGLFQPRQLLPLQLSGRAIVPCTCSVIIRREILAASGGMEASFTGMYEDQAFYSKVSLVTPVFVSTQCWDKYRQHSASMCAVSDRQGQTLTARIAFLEWLEVYLFEKTINDPEIWQALKRELWFQGQVGPAIGGRKMKILKRLKKWLLKLEESLLPVPVRRRIWLRDSNRS